MKYTCTYMSKTIMTDVFDEGCDPDSTREIMAESVRGIVEDSIPALIEAVGERYGLEIDDVCVYDDDGENVSGTLRIGFNRTEDGDGYEPSAAQLAAWKRGEEVLYLADYDFSIGKLTTITRAEIEAAGIKTH